jgi:hypothetical protein
MDERFSGQRNGIQYRNGSPQLTGVRMPDLPMKEAPPPDAPKAEAPKAKPKKKVVRRKRKSSSAGVKATSRQTAQMPATPKKELPRSSVSQPRDHLGRFARKTGAVLWGMAKGTARAVVGGVKTARKAHEAVSRAQASARRRQKIEMRERAVAVAEREKSVGKRKKVIRRRKR